MPTIIIDIDSKGVDKGEKEVNRALKAIQKNTRDTSNSLKRIDKGLNKTGTRFKQSTKVIKDNTGQVKKNAAALENLSKATRLVDGPLGGIASRFQTFNAILKSNAGGIAAVVIALAGLVFATKAVITVFTDLEKSQLTVEGALISTGRAAETSVQNLDEFAKQLGRSTLTSRSEVLKAAAAVSQFSNVATQDFERVLEAAQGLSAVLGGDIVSNATRLARVLQAPSQAISLLERATGKLTKEQKVLLKQLEETGNIAEAQDFIFRKFAGIIGIAEKQSAGLAGAFDNLGDSLTDLAANFGEQTGLAAGVAGAVNQIADSIDKLSDNLDRVDKVLQVIAGTFILSFGTRFVGQLKNKVLPIVNALTFAFEKQLKIIKVMATFTTGIAAKSLGKFVFVQAGAARGVALFAARSTLLTRELNRVDGVLKKLSPILGVILLKFRALASFFLKNPIGLAITGLTIGLIALSKANEDFVDTSTLVGRQVEANTKLLKRLNTEGIKAVQISVLRREFKETEKVLDNIVDQILKLEKQLKDATKSLEELSNTDRLRKGFETIIPIITDKLDELRIKADETRDSFKAIGEAINSINDKTFEPAEKAMLDLQAAAKKGFEKLATSIERGLSDAIKRSFDEPSRNVVRDFAKFMLDEFKQTFADIAAAALRQKFILPVVQGFASALGQESAFNQAFPGFGAKPGEGGTGGGGGGGTGPTSLLSAASSFKNSLPGSGANTFQNIGAGFAGNFAANAILGERGIGSTIGSVAGSIIGTAIAGPLGAFVGSFLGNAFGGLFGAGDPNPAASFFVPEIGAGGIIDEFNLLSKHIGTEFPDQLAVGVQAIISTLTQFGIDLEGVGIAGGVDVGVGFFGVPKPGSSVEGGQRFLDRLIEFDASDPDEVNDALAKLVITLAEFGEVADGNVKTALENIVTEGKTVDEVLSLLSFAAKFDSLFDLVPVFTELEQIVAAFNITMEEAARFTEETGLSEQQLTENRKRSIRQLKGRFDKSIQDEILSIINPDAFALDQLSRDFVERRRDAIVTTGDILEVERLFQLKRQQILLAGLGSLEDVLKRIGDFQASLRLDPVIGGLNRQGRAAFAQGQLDKLIERIEAGDITALEGIEGTVEEALRNIFDFFGPTDAFFTVFDQVDKLLEDSKTLASGTLSTEESILETNKKQLDALIAIQDAVSSDLVKLRGIGESSLLRAGDDPSILASDEINRLNNLSRDTVRRAKVVASEGRFSFDDPNFEGISFADFVKAGNAGAGERFLSTITALGGDVARQKEIFNFAAHGTGMSRISGLSVVGERGPELVNFGRSAQVFSNAQSGAILEGESGTAAEIRELRRQEDDQTNAMLDSFNKLTVAFLDLKEDLVTAN